MRKTLLGIAVLAGVCWPTACAWAGPDRIESYRFVRGRSVLIETFASDSRPVVYPVFGPFDFVTSPSVGDAWHVAARFDNVKAWASHPILAFVRPLKEVLALEELTGRQLPVLGPYDAYKFEGIKDDGAKVDLYASVIGPWFHLRGGTTFPTKPTPAFGPGPAKYEIRATARRTPYADFNENATVGGDDLGNWVTRFGTTPSADDTLAFGDANGDHVVDGADFLAWQRQLGETAPGDAAFDAVIAAAIASEAVAAQGVPEPSSVVLFAVAGALLIMRRLR